MVALMGLAACDPVEPTVQTQESPVASTTDTATPPGTSTAELSPLAAGTALPTEEAEGVDVSPISTPPGPSSASEPTDETQPPVAPATVSRLPIFVEVVQSPLSPDLPKMPPADTNPAGVYLYNLADGTLLVAPSIEILPSTEVLVGAMSANVPNRPLVASDLFQIPSDQPAPLQVIAVREDSGALSLAYGDKTFDLGPGQDLSFKESTEEDGGAIEVTTITNYGRLTGINPLPSDPGSP